MRVRVESLEKRFGRVIAVNSLNLDIEDGTFVALLGPSGCGKTTTLLMIAGIYQPTAGYIRFADRVVNHLTPRERNVGMVFQSYALYPHMSVYDNIAFPLMLRKVNRSEVRQRVREVAELVQIDSLLDRMPGQLSGGQQQRVALCRALVRRPDVLLLDEPLSNLDATLRLMMRAEIKRLQRELGVTSVFVTHDQVEAMTMADKVAVLNNGVLQAYDAPDVLYNAPPNKFVAQFIGSPPMNFIDVEVSQEGETTVLRGKSSDMVIRSTHLRHLTKAAVLMGIRPEHIVLVPPGEGDSVAEVYVVEPMGREVLVNLKLGSTLLRATLPAPFGGSAGDIVGIRFDCDKLHLFDPDTGERL